MKNRVQKSMRAALCACVCAGACLLAGCATQGTILNNCHWDNNVKPVKEGTASHCRVFFGVFGFGDLTLGEAMQDGKIQKIHHVDRRWNHWLAWPLFYETSIKVYGE